MLHNFRRAIVWIFLLSFAVFMLSSLGMIALFMGTFIQVEQPWQLSQTESFINDWNYFVKDYVSQHLRDFNSSFSKVDAAYRKYMSDVEKLADFIQAQNLNILPKRAYRISSALKHYSLKYGVPFDLAVAVAHTESHFDPEAKSRYGALGLMQVVWRVHFALLQANGIFNEEMIFQPEFGAAAGCLLLSRYIKENDNIQTALGKYYGGNSDIYWGRISRSLNSYRTHKNRE
ncbi:MAG: transglycosylase SLT domain-containing protein [Synergistaceae bacterium]|nr:transglycosylase SLT domain-containing protein [Synergistaceae bacterium]